MTEKYEKYRDSEASWIGMIPEHWRTSRLKWHLRRNEPRNPGGVQVLSLYRELGIVPKDSRDDNHNVTSEDTSNYKYVQIGDFVVNKMKAWQGSVAVSEYEGIVSPAYYVYNFTDDIYDKKYFHYLMRGCYKEEFMRLSGGIRIGQWDLSGDALNSVIVLIPPKEEQKGIADYLDRATRNIDSLIAEAQKSIAEYEKWKMTVIYEAVTKGISNKSELRDSGIEWMGDVPKDWKLVPLKYLYSFEKGKNAALYTQEYIGENAGEYPVYSGQTANEGIMGTINSYDYDIQECLFTTTVGAKVMTPKILRGKFNLSQNCLIMNQIRECSNRFIYYMLFPLFAYEKSLIPSYMQPSLRIEDLKRYKFYIPEIAEQEEIADYLDLKISTIDELIKEKQALVEDLTIYKKALIFEAATGKRKVV